MGPPLPDGFGVWFPRYERQPRTAAPAFRVFAFHHAGASDAVFADSKGALVSWARERDGEVRARKDLTPFACRLGAWRYQLYSTK